HAHGEPGRPGRKDPRLPDQEDAIASAERLCDAVSARNLGAVPAAAALPVPRCTEVGAMGG
ncbi:FUSC family protein, partial [Streptomyces carpinensis]